jgi:hypothetical protein
VSFAAGTSCHSLILAEAALSGCGLLVLNGFDLIPPVIASPREIVRKFFH